MLRHKFNAKRTFINEQAFDSKKEANRYQELCLLKKSGEIVFFLRHPRFDLPGGVKYIADFIIFWSNGDVTFEDVKGFKTKDFIMKQKIVESIYPIKIGII